MKIYILADMEGISGIRRMEEVKSEFASDYAHGCQLMMQDINVVVDACFNAGATEVVVADTHGGGGQVRMGDMDQRAVYEIPGKGMMMPSLDETFDGVILFGHHAKAGTVDGFLDHTMSSAAWFEYRLNDVEMGEIGIEAAWAGQFDVPVIMVQGDEATAREAKETLGEVECAVVKWGVGRNKAKCLPLTKAHAVVRETAERAVKNCKTFKPFKPTMPGTIQVTYYRSDMADGYHSKSDIERIDGRTIRKKITSLKDVCSF